MVACGSSLSVQAPSCNPPSSAAIPHRPLITSGHQSPSVVSPPSGGLDWLDRSPTHPPLSLTQQQAAAHTTTSPGSLNSLGSHPSHLPLQLAPHQNAHQTHLSPLASHTSPELPSSCMPLVSQTSPNYLHFSCVLRVPLAYCYPYCRHFIHCYPYSCHSLQKLLPL